MVVGDEHAARAVQQGSPDLERAGVEGQWRVVKEDLVRAEMSVALAGDQANHGAMGDANALRPARRARRVHHIGDVVGLRVFLEGKVRLGPGEGERIGEVYRRRREHAAVAAGREHQVGPAVAHDGVEIGGGRGRIERNVAGADLECRHDGEKRRQRPAGMQADQAAGPGALSQHEAGKLIGAPVELVVGHARAALDGSDRRAGGPHRGGEAAGYPLAGGRGIEAAPLMKRRPRCSRL